MPPPPARSPPWRPAMPTPPPGPGAVKRAAGTAECLREDLLAVTGCWPGFPVLSWSTGAACGRDRPFGAWARQGSRPGTSAAGSDLVGASSGGGTAQLTPGQDAPVPRSLPGQGRRPPAGPKPHPAQRQAVSGCPVAWKALGHLPENPGAPALAEDTEPPSETTSLCQCLHGACRSRREGISLRVPALGTQPPGEHF